MKRLTPKELLIASLVATGIPNGVIANELHLAEQTVKNHLRNVYKKLGVCSRVQLALLMSRSTYQKLMATQDHNKSI
jgi:DNA-binding NarL/FixJ family response regulator